MMHHVKRESDPSAFIAVKKNRVKQYNKKSETPAYYLEDGQEFQIELHNPRKYHVLAMIHLNGKLISNSGVILKPGQRLFLDRYIDNKRKLKFETYEVPDNEESRETIEYNGDLKIEFFHEDLESIKNNKKNIEEEVEELRRVWRPEGLKKVKLLHRSSKAWI